MKVIVVGGVAGGAGTAARIKRLCESCQVLVFEKGAYVSFANCGLPYHLSGAIPKRSTLILQNPKSLNKRSGIEVFTEHEIIKIYPENKSVDVKNLKTGEIFSESYDKLVLATGSLSFMPPIEGLDHPAVHCLTTIPDMDKIIQALGAEKKQVVVVGGGFIGIESLENLIEAGHDVSLLEKLPQVMPAFDIEMSAYIQKELEAKGARLYLGQGLQKIESRGSQAIVHSDAGLDLSADLIIMAVGVVPNNTLAKEAGLNLNQRGGLIVNEKLQSSSPDIYAVGDLIEVENLALQSKGMVPLAGPAVRQARIAAENIIGGSKSYKGVNPTAICKIFSLTAASTGANEKQLAGKDFHKVYVHPANHTSYYPGAEQMHIKLLYDSKGVVLGAQAIGGAGVDKCIDIFALAVRQKISVYDLAEQDFAYAPPFSSPRSPVHVAAFTAVNQLEGLSSPAFASDLLNNFILDVRENSETSAMPIKGAYHIPLGELRSRLGELDKEKTIILSCASGLRSYLAERLLKQKGFTVYNFSGGYQCLCMIK